MGGAYMGRGRGIWGDLVPSSLIGPVSLSRSPSICSLSENSGGLWNFVFGGLCEKQKTVCKVHLFFSPLPFRLCKTSFSVSFSDPLSLSAVAFCCCVVLYKPLYLAVLSLRDEKIL